jgi:hypothetical protein
MIDIGRYVEDGNTGKLRIICEAKELRPYIQEPWFHSYIEERLGSKLLSSDMNALRGRAQIGDDLLCRHACLCGSSGSGKTRLALHLLSEQIKAGCSVVMLDPKAETIRHMAMLACKAGIPAEQVMMLSPGSAGIGAPGWNPLDCTASGASPSQVSAELVSVLEKSTSSWGPRLQDVLSNALIIIAAYGLSLYELARFLQREKYRDGLLQQPLTDPSHEVSSDKVAVEEARHYFVREFASWPKSERIGAVAPVLNKFRELLRSSFLRSLLCARQTNLDISALWQQQGLVLVHLDHATLGNEGVRLLAGLLSHSIYRTAMRSPGPVPVVLALDEMGVSEGFVGSAVTEILAIARSQNLRLLIACQHLSQLSDGLRNSLLTNTAARAFFRLGYADARAVAASLSAGTGDSVTALLVDVVRRDREGVPVGSDSVQRTIRDGYGNALRLSSAAWEALCAVGSAGEGDRQLAALRRVAQVSRIGRLYIHDPKTREPIELAQYVCNLPPDRYRIAGPRPIRLVISFPRLRASVVSRASESDRQQGWAKTLMELPVRHAILHLPGSLPGIAEVVKVANPVAPAGYEKFISASLAINGQSARDIEETLFGRTEEIERIAKRPLPPLLETASKKANLPEPVMDFETSKVSGKRARSRSIRREGPRTTVGAIGEGMVPAISTEQVIGEDGSLA